jgi:hypothetical protein
MHLQSQGSCTLLKQRYFDDLERNWQRKQLITSIIIVLIKSFKRKKLTVQG